MVAERDKRWSEVEARATETARAADDAAASDDDDDGDALEPALGISLWPEREHAPLRWRPLCWRPPRASAATVTPAPGARALVMRWHPVRWRPPQASLGS